MESKSNARSVLVAVLILLTSTSILSSTPQAQSAPMRLPGEVHPVSVSGNLGPGNELCVAGSDPACLANSVQAGDQVTIGTASGTVNFDVLDNLFGCTYVTGPNGIARATFESNILCYPNESDLADPLPSAAHAGLYMKRGSLYAFVGASGTGYVAGDIESLYFGVNDGIPGNNSGAFNLSVTIVRGFKLYLPLLSHQP